MKKPIISLMIMSLMIFAIVPSVNAQEFNLLEWLNSLFAPQPISRAVAVGSCTTLLNSCNNGEGEGVYQRLSDNQCCLEKGFNECVPKGYTKLIQSCVKTGTGKGSSYVCPSGGTQIYEEDLTTGAIIPFTTCSAGTKCDGSAEVVATTVPSNAELKSKLCKAEEPGYLAFCKDGVLNKFNPVLFTPVVISTEACSNHQDKTNKCRVEGSFDNGNVDWSLRVGLCQDEQEAQIDSGKVVCCYQRSETIDILRGRPKNIQQWITEDECKALSATIISDSTCVTTIGAKPSTPELLQDTDGDGYADFIEINECRTSPFNGVDSCARKIPDPIVNLPENPGNIEKTKQNVCISGGNIWCNGNCFSSADIVKTDVCICPADGTKYTCEEFTFATKLKQDIHHMIRVEGAAGTSTGGASIGGVSISDILRGGTTGTSTGGTTIGGISIDDILDKGGATGTSTGGASIGGVSIDDLLKGGVGITGVPCSKIAGEKCTIKGWLPVRDDTQPSDECKSGICVDIKLGDGRCGEIGKEYKGTGDIKVEPHETCKTMGTTKTELEKSLDKITDFIKDNPLIVGIAAFALFILILMPRGRRS